MHNAALPPQGNAWPRTFHVTVMSYDQHWEQDTWYVFSVEVKEAFHTHCEPHKFKVLDLYFNTDHESTNDITMT